MDEVGFRRFLKRGGRSASAVDRVIKIVTEYEAYLIGIDKNMDRAAPADLESYVAWIENDSKNRAKKDLWAIRYYYQYTCAEQMEKRARELRQARIKREPFKLHEFRGVNQASVKKLEAAGIKDVEQMLAAGKTPQSRQALAEKTGVPLEDILVFVKLSDLARIPGLKSIRARLYYESGIDTVEKLAAWNHDELHAILGEYVDKSGFDGLAPLPKEVKHAVATARKLPQIVEY
jgi:predicted flap endonuclease-1-like 5' DNA nuclease